MTFEAVRLEIPDVILVKPRRHSDARGYFVETFRASDFHELGIEANFVQDNEAFSTRRGTIRGLHYQKPPYAQAKLVRVIEGSIFDVAVDLREGSGSFGRWVGLKIDASASEQLFVPRGFAHGYCTLEDNTRVAYRCDAYYAPEAEGGILFSDVELRIDWPFPPADLVVSEKDRQMPTLRTIGRPFSRP